MLHLFDIVWKFDISILGKVSLSSNYVYLCQWEVSQLIPHLHVVRAVLDPTVLFVFLCFWPLHGICQAASGISGFCLFCLGFGYFLFSALFFCFEVMAKDNCVSCGKGVGKTSHALQWACCAGWIHVGCDGIAEEDFAFMKTLMRYGFRWYCQHCLSSRTGEGAGADRSGDIIKTVTSAMETMCGEIFERMSRI